ncbi:DUF6542 domain-containing protein [Actinorugispora endophytica]|uniref:DUF6542 domain-containing protein n=1 Tax=Actinorugispora endophytica TaxID=1605990 RepID=A0A4R6VCU9_9ACTN|nr:DUF6542 domain-containing protein [Actinorugispora endophytica]TDQ54797.1 hypothetical protein EV190_101113 [Actinorugispora endophytica]
MTTRDARGARAPHRSGPPRRRGGGSAPVHTGPPLRLTARGAIVGVTLASFASTMLADAVERPIVSGIGFVAACVLAALLVRAADLLTLSVSPPLAYFVAALTAEIVLTLGTDGFARGVSIGIATRLADIAPWLFAGTALVLVVVIPRGLARNVRALGDELNGRNRRRP